MRDEERIPKLLNRCKRENRHERVWNMLKRILILEEERLPATNAREWKIEGQTRRVTKKEYKVLQEEFEVGGFMAGVLPREGGDLLREHQAMHEENFLSSWLRGDMDGENAEMESLKEEVKQEESKSGKRMVGGKMWRFQIKRRCLDRMSGEVFEGLNLFLRWRVWRFLWVFGVRAAVPLSVPDVTVAFSLVNVDCEVLFDSDCELVELVSLQKTRSVFCWKSRRHEW